MANLQHQSACVFTFWTTLLDWYFTNNETTKCTAPTVHTMCSFTCSF